MDEQIQHCWSNHENKRHCVVFELQNRELTMIHDSSQSMKHMKQESGGYRHTVSYAF